MGATPDQLKERIDHTRQELSSDVDSLADRVLPSRVAQRKVSAMRQTMATVRERVMGTAEHATQSTTGTLQAAAGSVSGTASTVAQHAEELPQAAVSAAVTRTQGNPLGAGLVAFGVGLVAASMLPETKAERQAGQALLEQAEPAKQAALHAAGEVAQEVKQAVAPAAEQAVGDLRQTVTEAVETTRDRAQSATSEVGLEAMTAAERARDQVRPSTGA